MSMRLRLGLLSLAALLTAGCATVNPYAQAPIANHLQRQDAVGDCARLYAQIDSAIDVAGVRDAEARRVPGFPYLRVNRFLQALAERAEDPAQQADWRRWLASIDADARSAEMANAGLPKSTQLESCRNQLLANDSRQHRTLVAAAQVPDDYSTGLRALGLYPLTRIAFAAGTRAWQNETREIFAQPKESLPVYGHLQRFEPMPGVPWAVNWPPPHDALGVPTVDAETARSLLNSHAPAFDIDVVADYDRPGTVVLDAQARAQVDTTRAAAYGHLAHTLFEGRPRLQLVYTLWFSMRPPAGALDLFAGHLDGLIWRVTLDSDGAPLLYDSIHACGCYHLFFPTQRLRARVQPSSMDEGLLAPQTLPTPKPGQRVLLRLASGTHYLQRVELGVASSTAAVGYTLQDEGLLRQLQLAPRREG
ncbi:MAG: hypothetical protein OEM00_12750, partial [Burkholderiaceae bacterium]|nr:hypothetical protein [Burkholderiaceae bacterium]